MNPEAPPHPLDPEKQPMAGAADDDHLEEGGEGDSQTPPAQGEKNGLVLKIPVEGDGDDHPPSPPLSRGTPTQMGAAGGAGGKFTGLGKEELLAAASTPPWRKARTFLLLLFWAGWLGMVGAAAAIVARAPRCRPLPPAEWWHLGGLYKAPPKDLGGDLTEVASRLELLAGLGARGLVLGPLHPSQDPPQLDQLDQKLGKLGDFEAVVKEAKKRGLKLFVDLTPNLGEEQVWGDVGAKDPQLHQKVEAALEFWLGQGASGIFLDGIEELTPSLVMKWKNQTQLKSREGETRVLVWGTRLQDRQKLQELLKVSGGPAGEGGLLLGPFIDSLEPLPAPEFTSQLLQFLHPETPLGWSMGNVSVELALQRLLLVWTLPGTPGLLFGDQVPWVDLKELREDDNSTQAQLLSLSRHLFALRSRERSLSLGDAEVVAVGPYVAAFLRHWDQSDRFLVLLNPTEEETGLEVGGKEGEWELKGQNSSIPIPPEVTLRLSTHRPHSAAGTQQELGKLRLQPHEGLLLSFPYSP